MNEAATNTNPTLVPNKSNPGTGIGWAATDDISVVVGGAEGIRVDSSNTTIYGGLQLQSFVNVKTDYAQFEEMTAPGAGAANRVRVYAVIDGGSLTDLAAVFQDGTVDLFAQEV